MLQFRTAVEIKGAQTAQDRKRYDTWPDYLKHTIFHPPTVTQYRTSPLEQRLEHCTRLKREGSEHFRAERMKEAQQCYEHALGVLWYVQHADPDWRQNRKGIRDEDVTVVQAAGATAEETQQVHALIVSCLVNISAVGLQTCAYSLAVAACSDALSIDPQCAKARYNRARAWIRSPTSGGVELNNALADLTTAVQLVMLAVDDGRSPDVALSAVQSLRAALMKQLKRQAETDRRTFGGMFNRSERPLYGDDDDPDAAQPRAVGKTLRAAQEAEEFDEQLERLTHVVQELRGAGRDAEADDVQRAVDNARARRASAAEGPPQPVDFARPTKQMREEAMKMGIDLDDPVVLRELQRLQSGESAADAVDGAADDRPDPIAPAAARSSALPRTVSFAIFFAFLLWRMHSQGLLSWLWRYVTGAPSDDMEL